MRKKLKLKVPKDFYQEQWVKSTALLLSSCCAEKVVFVEDKSVCTCCEKECEIIN